MKLVKETKIPRYRGLKRAKEIIMLALVLNSSFGLTLRKVQVTNYYLWFATAIAAIMTNGLDTSISILCGCGAVVLFVCFITIMSSIGDKGGIIFAFFTLLFALLYAAFTVGFAGIALYYLEGNISLYTLNILSFCLMMGIFIKKEFFSKNS